MDLWHLEIVLCELVDQFGGIQLAVASSSFDNLCLLIQCEVLPGEVWADVLLEEGEDFVVGDRTWVGEVVNSKILVLGHQDSGWKEIVENSVGVRDIDDTIVLGNLGDKVPGVEVVADWHTKSENENVGVVLHDL